MFGNALENIWGPQNSDLSGYRYRGSYCTLYHVYLTLKPDLTIINRFLADPGIVNLNDLIANHAFYDKSVVRRDMGTF